MLFSIEIFIYGFFHEIIKMVKKNEVPKNLILVLSVVVIFLSVLTTWSVVQKVDVLKSTAPTVFVREPGYGRVSLTIEGPSVPVENSGMVGLTILEGGE